MRTIAKSRCGAGLSVLFLFMGTAALADGAWIDALPGAWNAPGAGLPRAPAGNGIARRGRRWPVPGRADRGRLSPV